MKISPYEVVFFDLGDTLVDGKHPTTWVPDARGVLDLLHQKGLRLGLISNTGNLTRLQLVAMLPPDFDLAQFEDHLIIFSSEVGVEKPGLGDFSAGSSASFRRSSEMSVLYRGVASYSGSATSRNARRQVADSATKRRRKCA